jgi:cyclopropane-fatty-acyl-phospholipid synthase
LAHTLTGVTLSTEQLAFGRERMAAARRGGPGRPAPAGLPRHQTTRPFDAICSIEMVEAVGQDYWPTYFETVARLLRSGGRACIQSIVIDDALFPRYIRSTDFIQQYIFPGGCLPCPAEFRRAHRPQACRWKTRLPLAPDYAETLRRWRERFVAERAQVLQQGYDERFAHIWEFYLAYCEAAFAMGDIDVVQYTLVKP